MRVVRCPAARHGIVRELEQFAYNTASTATSKKNIDERDSDAGFYPPDYS